MAKPNPLNLFLEQYSRIVQSQVSDFVQEKEEEIEEEFECLPTDKQVDALKLSKEERAKLVAWFFKMDMNQIEMLRKRAKEELKDKATMHTLKTYEGQREMRHLLEHLLLRGYFSLSQLWHSQTKIDLPKDKAAPAKEQILKAKLMKIKELEVKILKLIYTALTSLGQAYFTILRDRLQILEDSASEDQYTPQTPSSPEEMVDLNSCLRAIVERAYSLDVGHQNPHLKKMSKEEQFVDFQEYYFMQFKLFATKIIYDSQASKQGMLRQMEKLTQIVVPSAKMQEEAYKAMKQRSRTEDFAQFQVYHIVSSEWITKWKKSIGFNGTEGGAPYEEPGPVNGGALFAKLVVSQSDKAPGLLHMSNSFCNNFQLSLKAIEDRDFKVLSDPLFKYLFRIYGGNDIRRLTILKNQMRKSHKAPVVKEQPEVQTIVISQTVSKDQQEKNEEKASKAKSVIFTPLKKPSQTLVLDQASSPANPGATSQIFESDAQPCPKQLQRAMESPSKSQVVSGSGAKIVEEYEVELYLKHVRVLVAPSTLYFPNMTFLGSKGRQGSVNLPVSVYISRNSTVQQLHKDIIMTMLSQNSEFSQALDLQRNPKADATIQTLNHDHSQQAPLAYLLEISRLWKVDWQKEFPPTNLARQIQEYMQQSADPSSTVPPIGINGELLDREDRIGDLEIEESEVIVLEVKCMTSTSLPGRVLDVEKSASIKRTESWALVESKGSPVFKNEVFSTLNFSREEIEKEISRRMAGDLKKQASNLGGLVGLKNLGNTCYMNSILQCVSNCPEVTKFFIFEVYQFTLNKRSSYGTKGKLALEYAELLSQTIKGSEKAIAPWGVRRIISQKCEQFIGNLQHDSQEFLSAFLENLHEDHNTISNKPYIQLEDYVGGERKPDAVVAEEYWNVFRLRESSFFVDLFYGQLKSKLSCTRCGHYSHSFETFNVLSLPIPTTKNQSITVSYIPYDFDFEERQQPLEFTLTIHDNMTLFELKKKIQEYFQSLPSTPPGWLQPFICSDGSKKSSSLDVLSDEKVLKTYLEKNSSAQFLAFEREPHGIIGRGKDESLAKFTLIEIRMQQPKRNLFLMTQMEPIGFPRLHVLKRSLTIHQVKLRVFQILRSLLIGVEDICSARKKKAGNNTEQEILEEEYAAIFLNLQTLEYNKANEYYDLEILNNISKKKKHACEFCHKEHSDNCLFDFGPEKNYELTVDNVVDMIQDNRGLELCITWKSSAKVNLEHVELAKFHSVDLDMTKKEASSSSKKPKSNHITIYDCFDTFTHEEVLQGQNRWNCPSCRTEVTAMKSISIDRLPRTLVVHLKRFHHPAASGSSSKKKDQPQKIQKPIDIPLEGLDLSKYCQLQATTESPYFGKASAKANSDGAVYDLFAVSNHHGQINGGHYTAYARSPISSKWYEFDDKHVTEQSEGDIKQEMSSGSAPYVLFYKLRS